ncbi:hypothetical protein PanWU01x14_081660 [Parasponia andersonii]|uniref:Uncharacterized protein n=1 Tax=Parasponia andersonii TaxID=3476 RepID=A0A2P5DAD7_PARAD|nr:hypothetical protein PanWU01x14_081660 [Parasponia andersonii]
MCVRVNLDVNLPLQRVANVRVGSKGYLNNNSNISSEILNENNDSHDTLKEESNVEVVGKQVVENVASIFKSMIRDPKGSVVGGISKKWPNVNEEIDSRGKHRKVLGDVSNNLQPATTMEQSR